MSCDLGPEPTVGQPQIEDHKVRLGMPCLRNRVGDGARDAAYFVTVLDKDLFREIRQHEIVLDNQDLEHALSSSIRSDRFSIANGQKLPSFLTNVSRADRPGSARSQLSEF